MGRRSSRSRSRERDRDREHSRRRRQEDSSSDTSSDSSSDSDTDRERSRSRKTHKKDRSSSSSSRSRRDEKKKKKDHKKKRHLRSRSRSRSRSRTRKSHKSDKKKKKEKSRSRRAAASSSSDSDASRSPSAQRRRHRSPNASSRSTIPPPSSSSVSRCLTLLDTLLQHGGGDPSLARREVQFLLFKLDSGSSVSLEGLEDPLVKHILTSMMRELGCKLQRDPTTGEEGWMTPIEPTTGQVAYKLLDVMKEAFQPANKVSTEPAVPAASASEEAATIGPIGPTAPPPPSSTASVPRVVGPAMPSAEDFDKLATLDETGAAAGDDEDEEAEVGGFGPKRPDQMSAQELIAFERLRASREQLAALKSMGSDKNKQQGGREEWMTSLPSAFSGQPSAALLVSLAASGDKDAMRGRGFQTKTTVAAEQDLDWTLSPAEKARQQAERIAVRQAEQAVYESSQMSSGSASSFSSLLGPRAGSANASAAAAQAANDRMMARYKKQQAMADDSLMAAHTRAQAEAAKEAKESDGLFRWDREKEMGMRAVKGPAALKSAMQTAFSLSDNFAPSSS